MINLKKLIDENDPKCLYCNNFCATDSQQFVGNIKPGLSETVWVNKFKCETCHNFFDVITSYLGKVVAQAFTCDDLVIAYRMGSDDQLHPFIKRRNSKSEISLPEEVDFSLESFKDKVALHNKLLTYLVLS